MEQSSIKEGDYVSWECGLEKGFGYSVSSNIVERIDGSGWGRQGDIPNSYVPRSTNKYWAVDRMAKYKTFPSTWSNVCDDSPKLSMSALEAAWKMPIETVGDYIVSTEKSAMRLAELYKLPPLLISTGDGVPMYNPKMEDIIKSNNVANSNLYNDMNIIDKIRVNIKGEPMKTLIKNEILTLDERLTITGKELFNDFLYAKFKDEFIADLAPKLEGLNDK